MFKWQQSLVEPTWYHFEEKKKYKQKQLGIGKVVLFESQIEDQKSVKQSSFGYNLPENIDFCGTKSIYEMVLIGIVLHQQHWIFLVLINGPLPFRVNYSNIVIFQKAHIVFLDFFMEDLTAAAYLSIVRLFDEYLLLVTGSVLLLLLMFYYYSRNVFFLLTVPALS